MNVQAAIIKISRILVFGTAICTLGAGAKKPEVYPELPEQNLGIGVELKCRNEMDCLVVNGWARIAQLRFGPVGLFAKSPIALCDQEKTTCEEAMQWEFDEVEGSENRLFLRSRRGRATNQQPVFVIEQHMSQNTPARVGIGVPPDHDVKHELEVNGSILAEKILVEAGGLFAKSPIALCDQEKTTCEEAMQWEFDEVEGSENRLFLRSRRGRATNQQPVFVIEQHMSQNAPARVGIGVPSDHDVKHALEVNGSILAEEILVEANVADYVFDSNYDLMPLDQVEAFIESNRHLPGIPSKSEVEASGGTVSIGDSYRALLEKVEELTLYAIDQNNRIKALEKLIEHTSRCDYSLR